MLEPRQQHGVHPQLLSEEQYQVDPPLSHPHHHHHHYHPHPIPHHDHPLLPYHHYHPQHYYHNPYPYPYPYPSFGAPHPPSLCPLRQPCLVPCLCTNCGSWTLSHPPLPPLAPPFPNQNCSSEVVEKALPQEVPVVASTGELEQPSLPHNLYHRQCDEEEDIDDESFELVLTDEWAEFFAKSKARRREKKRQQKKEAKARNAIANKEQQNTVESEMTELSLKE